MEGSGHIFPYAVVPRVPVFLDYINLYTYGDGSSGKKRKGRERKKKRRRLRVRSSLYANNNRTPLLNSTRLDSTSSSSRLGIGVAHKSSSEVSARLANCVQQRTARQQKRPLNISCTAPFVARSRLLVRARTARAVRV